MLPDGGRGERAEGEHGGAIGGASPTQVVELRAKGPAEVDQSSFRRSRRCIIM